MKPPRPLTTLFVFLPTKPKKDAIYWCVIEVDNGEEKELHYSYVEYQDKKFKVPESETMTFTVKAWTELPDPRELWEEPKQRPRIIRPNGFKIK